MYHHEPAHCISHSTQVGTSRKPRRQRNPHQARCPNKTISRCPNKTISSSCASHTSEEAPTVPAVSSTLLPSASYIPVLPCFLVLRTARRRRRAAKDGGAQNLRARSCMRRIVHPCTDWHRVHLPDDNCARGGSGFHADVSNVFRLVQSARSRGAWFRPSNCRNYGKRCKSAGRRLSCGTS